MEVAEKRLLSIQEVGTALGISRSTVLRLFESKALSFVRIGKNVRIPSVEVDRYIETLTHSKEVA